MSDYYGDATLESWLGHEVFFMENVPHSAVMKFEQWRHDVENNIEQWMQTDDGEGNNLSWRGWGRGFSAIADEDELSDVIDKCKEEIFETRRIVCAANRLPDDKIILGIRHWDRIMHRQVMDYMELHGKPERWAIKSKQGFIDQWGNFLNREAAWTIAEKQNQIVRRGPGFDGPLLFSENLY